VKLSLELIYVWLIIINASTSTLKEETAMLLASFQNKGQGLVEYALIISFVALVVIVVLYIFGPLIGSTYSNIVQNV
jgi:Flp pilus assembly pilin Flp